MRLISACVLASLAVGCSGRSPEQAAREDVVPANEPYLNPVDGKTYVAPGGWKTHQPETRRPDEPGKKVKVENVRLLTSEADISIRTSVSDLATFLREAERLADETLGKSGRQFQVIAQFKCNPAGQQVELSYQGDATKELLQAYFDALEAAGKLPVKGGEVAFQIELTVSP
ncbi:hypothetical protein P12x_000002 [Tundrisphaera lichenicola]|uniref:hypothetical protein n=1 Tax=Tundrisphaera lichenicola TaxID=2029860 RepID=UPI003EB88148